MTKSVCATSTSGKASVAKGVFATSTTGKASVSKGDFFREIRRAPETFVA